MSVKLVWLNSTQGTVRTDPVAVLTPVVGVWQQFSSSVATAPVGAVTVRVMITGSSQVSAFSVDDLVVGYLNPVSLRPAAWSYGNLHGDIGLTTDPSGVPTGTYRYDPYGTPLSGVPDDQAGDLDYGWLGIHQRPLEHGTGIISTIEMGARPYQATLGRFLGVDPIEGGTPNDYTYPTDPINQYDINGQCGTFGNPFKKCGAGHRGSVGFLGGAFSKTARFVQENPQKVAGWVTAGVCIVGTAACLVAAGALTAYQAVRSYERNGGVGGSFVKDVVVATTVNLTLAYAGAIGTSESVLPAEWEISRGAFYSMQGLFSLPSVACSSVNGCAG
jgi:RHS repeat-associated protein